MLSDPMTIQDPTTAEETISSLIGIWELIIANIEDFGFDYAKGTMGFYMSMHSCLNNAAEAFRFYLEHRPIDRKKIERAKTLVAAYKDLMDFLYTPLLTRWRDHLKDEELLKIINAHQSAENIVGLTRSFSRFYGSSERFSLVPPG